MSTTFQLLGPPGIHLSPDSAADTAGGNFVLPSKTPVDATEIESLASKTETLVLTGKPQMGLTENLSPTFLSAGNPCLDFFFHVVPSTPPSDLIRRLQLAWAYNPLTTLKLICNLRGVKGTGKSDKEGFYTAAFWLHQNHPKTLACNVRAIADFGYIKDLVEILYRILEGFEVRKLDKEARKRKSMETHFQRVKKFREKERFKGENRNEKENGEKKEKIVKSMEELKEEQEKARVLRKEREIGKAKKALEKYESDLSYQFLHDQISGFFAELLESDVENLKSGNLNKISLAAKWCPSIGSSYDKATLICESIARRLFPRELYNEYRVRDRLRKEVLVPLHKALELPEVFMSANQWDELPYTRVASVAMKNYMKFFLKHTPERFTEYLEKVKTGKVKIAAGALLPHEIIGELVNEDSSREVAELQWKRMVDDLAKKGKLMNSLSICDVSGSMIGTPLEVSVALGVLVSELSEEPWRGKLITFSSDPELQKVEGNTLLEKTQFVRNMSWGMNTDFQKVFDRILEVAVNGKLSDDQMIKRVFVFSDMEFDQASENPWETDYQAIKRKFGKKGYENVPEIVFWNLRHSSSTPVMAKQSGVAMVSGFSKNLLTIFLEGGGVANPEEVMELAIAGEEYKKLGIFD